MQTSAFCFGGFVILSMILSENRLHPSCHAREDAFRDHARTGAPERIRSSDLCLQRVTHASFPAIAGDRPTFLVLDFKIISRSFACPALSHIRSVMLTRAYPCLPLAYLRGHQAM